jgi:hypothetical protein
MVFVTMRGSELACEPDGLELKEPGVDSVLSSLAEVRFPDQ